MPDRVARGGWQRWAILAGVSVISSIVIGALMVSVGVYAPAIEQTEHWNGVVLGSAGTVLLLCMGLAGIAAGYALERFRAHAVVLVGLVLTVAGCALAASASAPPAFLLGFVLVGTGTGVGTTVPSILLLTRHFERTRALSLGIYFAALSIGSAGIPKVVSVLIETHGWRTALRTTSVAALLLCLLVPLLRAPRDGTAPTARVPGTPAGRDEPGLPAGRILRAAGIWGPIIAMVVSQLNLQGVLFATVGYLAHAHIGMPVAVDVYSAANLLSIPGVLIAGAVADRAGARKVMVVGLVIQALGTFALALFPAGSAGAAMIWIPLGIFIVGWGAGSPIPAQMGPLMLRDAVGHAHYARVLGYATSAAALIGALAPLAAALSKAAPTGLALNFVATAALCVVVAGALTRGRKARHAPSLEQ